MPLRLEDYGLIGDTQSAALVGYDGSIDWLCLPRFDSEACFAALLGDERNGRWLLAPAGGHRATGRRYRPDTLVLETDFTTADGTVRVTDCMPVRKGLPDVFRRVEGLSGRVRMRSEMVLRTGYGRVVPWVRQTGRHLLAAAGPDGFTLDSDVEHELERDDIVAEFEVQAGQHVDFRLAWTGWGEEPPAPLDVSKEIEQTAKWWQDWTGACRYEGEHREAVVRSLITLKAMSYGPSGGIVAAPTTSLPEQLGGVRNWDYRFCWIRDATFTLLALLDAGYEDEAVAWREWLLRAVAGRPEQMQLMYGVEGERRLTEFELDWLPGYAGSRPVRAGNAASGQFQLDVYSELMDALHQARSHGIPPDEQAWAVQRVLMDFLESHWRDPDEGIWEIRGERRHFTHSKVMAWAAVDRAVRGVEDFGLDGPLPDWKRLRSTIHDEVCEQAYDRKRNTFTQYYGSSTLDAALLLMSSVGFLPATDKRMRGTVAAIEKELCRDGFVQRYTMTKATEKLDGLPPGEGAFLPCTFWLADHYLLAGRGDGGRAVFDRLLGLRNDLGLLSEEYDVAASRLVGNFPQALTHLSLVNTALDIASAQGPSHRRSGTGRKK
ncbi:glycoside hydrolase family 15 protein [Pseudonocardia nigra]|uniref:glycoside hydrolase family 15 protein n=1 Tax=Pseudonocardia nigra TaxID=1921578 RepID=UPI001C6000F6|nr:glycoside hydrolase family 15 protein [Pseudonocardia nigra]